MVSKTYLMTFKSFYSSLEILAKNPTISEKERNELIHSAIDKIWNNYEKNTNDKD